MAGGIDWFRWHHGSVTDPKFQLVARKSKQALASVIAVWAFVLEQASASEERGTFGSIDCESIDCLLGLGDGATEAILIAMGERGLVAGDRVGAWEKRQPKREDETSAERKRRQREREHELKMADVVTCEQSRNVTQGHTQVTQGHDRGEERRVEKKKPPLPPEGGDELFEQFWQAYPRKVGKDSAVKAFKKRKPNAALLTAMLAAIAVQAGSSEWQKDGGQFIPHPATWLNDGRWQDEGVTIAPGVFKRGSDEYAAAHKHADWWRAAGFDSVWEADAHKCWHDNAHQFNAGKRIKVAA